MVTVGLCKKGKEWTALWFLSQTFKDNPSILMQCLRPSTFGLLPSAYGLRPMAYGLRPVACGLRPAACGLRPVACGLWPSACGLRPAACGLRPTAYGLRPSAFGFINQNVLGKQGNSHIISNPFWHKLAKRGIKIEEYLYSRYSLGANTKSTGTKGVYGNNIPSVLTFSS